MKLFLARLSAGVSAVVLASLVSFAQEQNGSQSEASQDEQKQTQKEQSAAQEQAKKDAKDEKEAKNKKEAKDKAEDAAQDAREQAQEARQDARENREQLREETQQQRQEARQEVRDARESLREDRRETREDNRDGRQDARDERGQRVRSFFRGRTNDDLGLRFDDNRSDRLMILNLDRNSLGARIGLRRGDAILSIDGQGVRSGDDFNRRIGANPERANSIVIDRNGRQLMVQLQPQSDAQWRDSFNPGNPRQRRAYLGVTFDPGYREFVVIKEVQPGSPAEKIGLQSGDTLTHIDGQEVRSLQHALRTLSMMPPGEEFELQYDRPKHETVRVALAEPETRESQPTFDDAREPQQGRQEQSADQQQ